MNLKNELLNVLIDHGYYTILDYEGYLLRRPGDLPYPLVYEECVGIVMTADEMEVGRYRTRKEFIDLPVPKKIRLLEEEALTLEPTMTVQRFYRQNVYARQQIDASIADRAELYNYNPQTFQVTLTVLLYEPATIRSNS
jgi:hypothetical protein